MSQAFEIKYNQQYFKTLLYDIAQDAVKVNITAALIEYCSFCPITTEELNYLVQFVNKQQRKLPSDHPNLLFLQSIVSMYQYGLASSKTLNLLKQARQQGHPSTATLLGVAYQLNGKNPWWLSPPTRWVARFQLWRHTRGGKIPTALKPKKNIEDKKYTFKQAIALFEEAEAHGDTAAIVYHADWILSAGNVKIQGKHYYKGLALYDKAIQLKDPIARCMRADRLLIRYYNSKKQNGTLLLTESEKNQALQDMDAAAKQGLVYAIAAKHTFAKLGLYLSTDKLDIEEIQQCRRLAHLSGKSKFFTVTSSKLSRLQQQNQGQDPRIDYYVITSLNHKRPFIFWRKKIVALCEGRGIKECRELLQSIDQDIYLTEKQRRYFKTEILKRLSAAPNIAEFLQDGELGEFYLAYIDECIAKASNDKEWEHIETLYRQVPYSSPISACVNARLADAYYQAALDAGCSTKEAFEAAKPYHQLVFKAVQSAKKIYKEDFLKTIEKGGFSVAVHQLIYQERQYKGEPTLKHKNAFNGASTFYYEKLSQYANAPVSDNRLGASNLTAHVAPETIDNATQVLKEGLTSVSMLSSHTPLNEKPAASRFFLLALFDTVYQFFQARCTSSKKEEEKKISQASWQFFVETKVKKADMSYNCKQTVTVTTPSPASSCC